MNRETKFVIVLIIATSPSKVVGEILADWLIPVVGVLRVGPLSITRFAAYLICFALFATPVFFWHRKVAKENPQPRD